MFTFCMSRAAVVSAHWPVLERRGSLVWEVAVTDKRLGLIADWEGGIVGSCGSVEVVLKASDGVAKLTLEMQNRRLMTWVKYEIRCIWVVILGWDHGRDRADCRNPGKMGLELHRWRRGHNYSMKVVLVYYILHRSNIENHMKWTHRISSLYERGGTVW